MVKLKNAARPPRMLVYNLSHREFCKSGECACATIQQELHAETEDGKPGVRLIERQIASSLTIPPGHVVEADDRVLNVVAVKRDIDSRALRKVQL